MAFKTVVDKLEDVEEALRPHYVEIKDAKGATKFVVGLEGDINLLPQAKPLHTEAASYRVKLRDFEEKYGKLKGFEGMDHAEVIAKLDRVAELEAAAGGKLDDKKIDDIVESRMKTKLAPVEREKAQLIKERDELRAEKETFTKRERDRTVKDAVRSALDKSKGFQTSAADDALLLAERVFDVSADGVVTVKDNVGATPGVSPEVWLTEMQSKRPHWWGASAGGGAGGNNGGAGGGFGQKNPWSHEHWNMTEQSAIYRADSKKAEQMAVSAGTKVGGARPAKKS
jgi:hypothetical protein